ncbi:alpha/beta fold hydrolase [Pedobacter sp. Hv1]|uniref:alpha/beta fold hydrolase n=1 Tax=Pedobacter sp. Hv1 TaxID=1740090 RepID=UPI000B09C27D|nr:alpha/beta fold hydrolase [Pedobacter sp. Hv1]
MRAIAFTIISYFVTLSIASAQNYQPKIESFACTIKIGPGVIARCGYLVVPENRQQVNGRQIKIPFLFVRKTAADSTQNISLYTTGGPGYSTIANIDQISESSGFLKYGGFIAFDQRGTKKSIPSLDLPEVGEAIKQAYRDNLPPEKLVLAAVKTGRKKFTDQDIDLSAYNTIESAADIADLKKVLKIESITLVGISYSGGLMLTVARNHPEGIKALVLNSPLPSYVNYEENGLFNINEALNQVFDNCEADSSHQVQYQNLRSRFQEYFKEFGTKKIKLDYTEKGTNKVIPIFYGKQELLDAIIGRMDNSQLKSVPFVIQEIISGKHEPYVKQVLDDVFSGNPSLSLGMRYSIYCSEQIAYADPLLIQKQEEVLPWLKGYRFNNVNHPICECWKVKPEPQLAKTPVYSRIPVLLSAGDADPWCRPFYNKLIKRTMPNSQLLLIHNRAHSSGFTVNGVDYLEMFMRNPYQKIVSQSKDLKVE